MPPIKKALYISHGWSQSTPVIATGKHFRAAKDGVFLLAAIRGGVYVNTVDESGRAFAHSATTCDDLAFICDSDVRHLPVVVDILERGMSVNAVDEDGGTLMHWAARGSQVHVIKELSRRGGNPRAKSNIGHTPMHYAAGNCDAAVMEAIMYLCGGGGASDVNKYGWSPFHWLAGGASNYPSRADAALAALVQCTDLNFSAKNDDGRTAACVARARHNEVFAIKIEQVP